MFIIINTLMDIAETDFYGCEIKPDGIDALLSVKLSTFYIDMTTYPDQVIDILSQADELTFVPGDNHMTVCLRLKEFYELRKDDGWF